MKIVLRHTVTGHYYNAPGKWVRRSDNALAFDDLPAACEFSRMNHLECAQPVQRLAPYLKDLLKTPPQPLFSEWTLERLSRWYFVCPDRFCRN